MDVAARFDDDCSCYGWSNENGTPVILNGEIPDGNLALVDTLHAWK